MKSVFYRIFHFLLYWPFRLVFRTRVRGSGNEPRRKDGPYLVCANHQSVVDPILIALATHRQQPHFMAKEELFRVPVLGRVVRWLGAYPVARQKGGVGAVKNTIALLSRGVSVGMFPQGHRYPGQDPAGTPVKQGAALIAAHTGVQILPVHIKMKEYRWKFFRRATVVVGKPIPFADFHYEPGKSGEYERITRMIFEEICRLGEGVK